MTVEEEATLLMTECNILATDPNTPPRAVRLCLSVADSLLLLLTKIKMMRASMKATKGMVLKYLIDDSQVALRKQLDALLDVGDENDKV